MPETPSAPQNGRIPDPREVLDGVKRAKILALLTMGCSRRMAARQVGCAPSTITRTADRDEEFREQIAEAESQADVRALRLISRTAEQERYWRVAAWVLERRNPEEYGRRAPFTFTGTQVTDLLLRGLRDVVAAVPEEKLPDVMVCFHDLISDVADSANLRPMEIEELLAETMLDTEEEAEQQAPEEQPPEPAVTAKAEPAAKPAVPAARNGHHAPSRNGGPAAKPPAGVEEYIAPRRTSCLEQFVQRTPRPELQSAGT
jgi:hypothetical protein